MEPHRVQLGSFKRMFLMFDDEMFTLTQNLIAIYGWQDNYNLQLMFFVLFFFSFSSAANPHLNVMKPECLQLILNCKCHSVRKSALCKGCFMELHEEDHGPINFMYGVNCLH